MKLSNFTATGIIDIKKIVYMRVRLTGGVIGVFHVFVEFKFSRPALSNVIPRATDANSPWYSSHFIILLYFLSFYFIITALKCFIVAARTVIAARAIILFETPVLISI
jgi:hypothetical protein